MLAINALHAHYDTSHVLQGIELHAAAGEVVGIFGRNGVGKTTLLRTIAGWLVPTSGQILFQDADIGGLPPDTIAHRGIGFVPEDRRIFAGLTVEENLRLGLMQTPGRSAAARRDAMAKVYEHFPRLAERRSQMGVTLSGGEQQMLAIARVLVGDQKLLLIDEPSEGLAPQIVAEIFATLQRLKSGGMTILLVEQNVRRALEVADRICAVERGQIVFSGSARNENDCDALLKAIAV
jgi:branched-chain amino acid transport system ATP-binding protein